MLSAQAGYPKGAFRGSFDPKMGRGYDLGNQVLIPAGESVTLTNHGLVDHYFRWKVSLYAAPAPNVVYQTNHAYYVDVLAEMRAENDDIPRPTQVAMGRGQVLYAPGRAINVVATNPTERDIVLHYSMDEATPGLSAWTVSERFTTDSGELELTVAPFAQSLQVLGLSGGVGWTLRGYDIDGNVLYQETLTMPRSAQIPVAPSLLYTLQPSLGGTHTCMVVYQCVG